MGIFAHFITACVYSFYPVNEKQTMDSTEYRSTVAQSNVQRYHSWPWPRCAWQL